MLPSPLAEPVAATARRLVPSLPRPTRIAANGTTLAVRRAGSGSPLVLLHGWPHTSALWSEVWPALTAHHDVIAPDLRGTGGSDRETSGYDAATGADDVSGLMDALGVERATVVAIDASVPAAFALALRRPARIAALVLAESLLPGLPGAEAFLRAGPPWWFGFHGVPGLAAQVLDGHEDDYLDWFLRAGSFSGDGVPPPVRDEFVDAYRGYESLDAGFGWYRAMPGNAALLEDLLRTLRLTVPTVALGGRQVGAALAQQLARSRTG